MFDFPARAQVALTCNHHEAALPLNFVATSATFLSSETLLNSNTSWTATSQSNSSSPRTPPWNSGISTLKPISQLLST
ncbi:hypothetical protein YC2023_075587 [Brassica napus]